MADASVIEGAVDRETVVRVLMASGVVISRQQEGPDGMLVLSKDGYFESKKIPLVVHKKLLHNLARKFSVPMRHFYNPHLIVQGVFNETRDRMP
jgi:hypothetical protein